MVICELFAIPFCSVFFYSTFISFQIISTILIILYHKRVICKWTELRNDHNDCGPHWAGLSPKRLLPTPKLEVRLACKPPMAPQPSRCMNSCILPLVDFIILYGDEQMTQTPQNKENLLLKIHNAQISL